MVFGNQFLFASRGSMYYFFLFHISFYFLFLFINLQSYTDYKNKSIAAGLDFQKYACGDCEKCNDNRLALDKKISEQKLKKIAIKYDIPI